MIKHQRRLYPFHITSIHPYFIDLLVYLTLKGDKLILAIFQQQEASKIPRGVQIPDILNTIIVPSHVLMPILLIFDIPGTNYTAFLSILKTFHMDSEFILLTAKILWKTIRHFQTQTNRYSMFPNVNWCHPSWNNLLFQSQMTKYRQIVKLYLLKWIFVLQTSSDSCTT